MTIEQYFRNLASAAFVPLFFWAVLAVSMHQDRSRYRNTIYLMLAMVSSLPFAAALFGPAEQTAAGVISAGILILLLAVPYMLIANGVTMIRKEGRRLADLLSLLMGILVGTGELSFFLFILLPYLSSGASGTAGNISKVQMSLLFIGLSVIYFSLVFVSFMFYTRFMSILPIRKDFDCCIILGCGLLAGGKVSKLLAGRLDKAIELYRKDPTPPVMIPSGGQGPDEAVSEASAMRDYLIANGIPEDMIRIEDKSANTEENIRNSMKILNACPGDQYTAVVTSDYHVYRALRICKKEGLKCTGIGSRTASYYWPSALIREFAAVHREPKHLALLLAGWTLILIPYLYAVLQ